jgi:hypothetical protein
MKMEASRSAFARTTIGDASRRTPMMVDAMLVRGLGKALSKTTRLRKLLKSLSA